MYDKNIITKISLCWLPLILLLSYFIFYTINPSSKLNQEHAILNMF